MTASAPPDATANRDRPIEGRLGTGAAAETASPYGSAGLSEPCMPSSAIANGRTRPADAECLRPPPLPPLQGCCDSGGGFSSAERSSLSRKGWRLSEEAEMALDRPDRRPTDEGGRARRSGAAAASMAPSVARSSIKGHIVGDEAFSDAEGEVPNLSTRRVAECSCGEDSCVGCGSTFSDGSRRGKWRPEVAGTKPDGRLLVRTRGFEPLFGPLLGTCSGAPFEVPCLRTGSFDLRSESAAVGTAGAAVSIRVRPVTEPAKPQKCFFTDSSCASAPTHRIFIGLAKSAFLLAP